MKEEKDLQKLTEKETKFNALWQQDRITPEDIREKLIGEDRDEFLRLLFKKLNSLKGEERDLLHNQVEALLPDETKNRLWEYNHNQITWAISTLMQDNNRMPTGTEIASKTELSRQTVHKHLKNYRKDARFLEMEEQYCFMKSKVLAKVFKFAVNGDIKAARLYFDVVGTVAKRNVGQINNIQNNYIQINQIKISQDNIMQLSPEKLNQIEAIVKDVCTTNLD